MRCFDTDFFKVVSACYQAGTISSSDRKNYLEEWREGAKSDRKETMALVLEEIKLMAPDYLVPSINRLVENINSI